MNSRPGSGAGPGRPSRSGGSPTTIAQDRDARIIVSGDFNLEPDAVPVFAIRGIGWATGPGDVSFLARH